MPSVLASSGFAAAASFTLVGLGMLVCAYCILLTAAGTGILWVASVGSSLLCALHMWQAQSGRAVCILANKCVALLGLVLAMQTRHAYTDSRNGIGCESSITHKHRMRTMAYLDAGVRQHRSESW